MIRSQSMLPVFQSTLGHLYKGDCLKLFANIPDDSVDLVFADPPFNLGKKYPSQIDDNLEDKEYISWCRAWTTECARVLKPGGSFFLYNLPKWNLALGEHLSGLLTFRHWIAVEMSYRLPIQGRLYPSHYSLLYFVKGKKPNVFTPDRIAMETCRHCFGEIKDYGGYKDKMNPAGINLSDVWRDIPPVRHPKFKRRHGANELSVKLLDRIIRMASKEGDTVLDPFGGSGTTYIVSEILGRRWIGMEIGPADDIIARFSAKNISDEKQFISAYRATLNHLFPPDIAKARSEAGMWTPGNIPSGKKHRKRLSPDMQECLPFSD